MKYGQGRAPTRSGAGPEVKSKADDKYKVEAVARAASLLDALRRQPEPSSMEVLAAATGVGQSIAAATLATLVKHGLVRALAQDTGTGGTATGPGETRYALGLTWLLLADVKRQQLDIREIARPVMGRVRDAVNETVSLAIRIGTRRVNLDYAEGRHEVRRITQPGYHAALHVGAAGRVLLSALEDAEIEDYVAAGNANEVTASGRISKARLMAQVAAVRRDGHAVVAAEITSDTAAVSAPIRNHVGDIVAALTISCPQDRFGAQVQTRFIRQVTAAAAEISMVLGHDPAGRRATPMFRPAGGSAAVRGRRPVAASALPPAPKRKASRARPERS